MDAPPPFSRRKKLVDDERSPARVDPLAFLIEAESSEMIVAGASAREMGLLVAVTTTSRNGTTGMLSFGSSCEDHTG
jgi:hypothetical protein